MNEQRRLDWLGHEIVGNPRERKLRVGLAREVPEATVYRYDNTLLFYPSVSNEPLSVSMLFMHESIFAEGEKVEDIPLEYEAPRMLDVYSQDEADEMNYRIHRIAGDRVQDYLEGSKTDV